jgi:biopolymer transport protein ExbB/biopolymer transport protein TolQ
MSFSIAEIWADTGWLNRGIVILLILMSVLSLSVAVAKWLRFRKMATATRAFAPAFSQALEQDNIAEALATADQYPNSHVARVLGESLGTTLGIVNAFMGMASQGGGLEAVSSGIAEALIATAIGLIAAIPAVWLYNYFTAKLDTLFSELAYAGREMIDWMMTRQAKRDLGITTRNAPAYGD